MTNKGRRARLAIFAASLAVSFLGASCAKDPANPPRATPPRPSPKSAERAPVVVAFVVDQFSAWIAEERLPKLPPDGFFARMTREGTWVRAMRYPYAVTDTAPGHAALHTGKVPAESRIVVNEVPDAKTGKRSTIFRDPKTKTVTPAGTKDKPASSASRLGAETVADRLKAAHPDARVISVSLKDRAALLPAGKRPDHAIWFDGLEDSFVTSTAVEPTFPEWGRALADPAAVKAARSRVWEPTDARWLAAVAREDAAPGEGDLDGLGITFPHRAKTNRAFRATPMGDEMILALALAGAKAEHDPTKPLLLLVSLSAFDMIGHTFGPSSWESWDHLRKLDAMLAGFLSALESAVGPTSVLLSGDHGTVAMPEARTPMPALCNDASRAKTADPYERPLCVVGGRIEPDELRAELRAEVSRVLGRDDLVAGLADGYVFLTPEGRALEAAKRSTLDAIVRQVLLEKHGAHVAEIHGVSELAERCPGVLATARKIPDRARPGEDILTLVCRSWTDGADAGDYYVVPKYGSFFDAELVPGKGTNHGTPYLYDRTVPLFVRAPGAIEAGAVIADPVDFTAYAALEAAFLGLDRANSPRAILDALRAR